MEENQKSETTFGIKMKKWLIRTKNRYVSDFKENIECHIIIISAIVYALLFLCCDMILLNQPSPKDTTEVIGLIFLFRFICNVAFFFFGAKLRKIGYDNRNWAKWLLIIALFATFVTFGSCSGFHWGQIVDLVSELPLIAVAIYIIIKHHKDERGY